MRGARRASAAGLACLALAVAATCEPGLGDLVASGLSGLGAGVTTVTRPGGVAGEGFPGGAAARAASAAAVPPAGGPPAGGGGAVASGPRPVDVVFVAPAGLEPDPRMTEAGVRDVVGKASAWWSSQTAGRVSFLVDSVLPWRRSTLSCRDVEGLWAQAAEWVPRSAQPGRHLLLVLPRAAADQGCQYGFGSMGNLSSAGSVMITELVPSLVAHELGHNLGLGHAHALSCPHSADGHWDAGQGHWAGGCKELPYDDLLDVMGYSGPGFGEAALNGVHVDALGLEPGAVRRVSLDDARSVRVQIPPLASGRPDRVVRIAEPSGPVYYVEYRTAIGADARYAASGWFPQLGVRVLRADPRQSGGSGSIELDATPHDRAEYQRALPAGGEFVSASGRLRLRTISAGEAGATVEISRAEPVR